MKRRVYFHYSPAGRIDTACRIAGACKYGKVIVVTNDTLN